MSMRKVFNGRLYTLYHWYARKRDALKVAKRLKEDGKYRVRVTESNSGVYVWICEY